MTLARMTLENRYTYKAFIDNGRIHSEWGGGDIFSLPIGWPRKI